jgi:hypothetical protein
MDFMDTATQGVTTKPTSREVISPSSKRTDPTPTQIEYKLALSDCNDSEDSGWRLAI